METCYPISIPVRSAVPTFEPVTVQEVKRKLGIADAVDQYDLDMSGWITSARKQLERQAMLVCATGTFTVKRTGWGPGDYFELPSSLRPCSAVTAITYVDSAGATQTWSTSQYSLDTFTIQPIVKLGYGYVWPSLRGDINGITITATAGYASAALVPDDVKDAIAMRIRAMWSEQMGDEKASKLSQSAYENMAEQLRHEVYA